MRVGKAGPPSRGIRLPGYERKDQNWSLVTTSVTADQEIGSVTPTSGKVFKIQAIILEVYLTVLDTTAVYLGDLKLRWGTDALVGPFKASNTSSGALFGFVVPIPDEGLEVLGDGSKTLNAVCTPAAVTSTVWKVTIIGYEKD